MAEGSHTTSSRGTGAARERTLRAQGRKTRQRLADAALRVFAARGYHQARVDDIVRAARTSHGTFYLYFANKEDLLQQLAADCAAALEALAGAVPDIGPDADGEAALRTYLESFVDTYGRYGVVIRAWMERQVTDRTVDRLGVQAFTHIAQALAQRLAAVGAPHDPETVAALMAMLERTTYAMTSRDLALDRAGALDTLAAVVHRGFFVSGAA